MPGRKTKTLYFDIDGTLLADSAPKSRLAAGAFERSVRAAGFQRLVCVGNAGVIVRTLGKLGQTVDGVGLIFRLCQGVFRDEVWFREVTTLVADPEHRARFIDRSCDWWYVDDLARQYFTIEGWFALYREGRKNKRILEPEPESDGSEILAWLMDSCS